jgi:hypothetical protein
MDLKFWMRRNLMAFSIIERLLSKVRAKLARGFGRF